MYKVKSIVHYLLCHTCLDETSERNGVRAIGSSTRQVLSTKTKCLTETVTQTNDAINIQWSSLMNQPSCSTHLGVFVRFDPPKDGNCQFSAVSDQLLFRTSVDRKLTAHIIRQEVVNHLTTRPYSQDGSHLSNFVFPITDWNTYLYQMNCNGTFGDGTTLFSVARLYSVQIVVLSSLGVNGTRVFLPEGNLYDVSLPVILIGHISEGKGDHYVSLETATTEIMTCIVNDAFKIECVSDIMSISNYQRPHLTSESLVPSVTCDVRPNIISNISETRDNRSSAPNHTIVSHSLSEPAFDGDNMFDCDLNENDHIPSVWTLEQFIGKQKQYPWLVANKKRLGCSTCKNVSKLGVDKAQGVRMAIEWTNGSVCAYGDSREKQLLSLRKKIYEHRVSAAHTSCEKILSCSKSKQFEECNAKLLKVQEETTCRVFRTVYNIAKKGRPFVDLGYDVDLQILNGVDMGRTLHSNVTCANIADHIAHEMRQKLVANVCKANHKFSILIDESTTLSRKTTLIVYMRSCVAEATEPVTFFLDLIELERTTAQCIMEALIECLLSFGITLDIMRESWVCCATDGASVMLGKTGGVCSLLLIKFPNMVIWHCSSHRLELAVHDTIQEVSGINHFQIFFDKLYALYHASPKNQRELQECCEALHIQCLSIGRMLGTRWVASSLRTVRAVWNGYSAIVRHVEQAACDSSRDSKERSQYAGLARKLTTVQFVHNLGIMYDALTELADVSLMLQKKDMSLPNAHNILTRQLRVFMYMADNDGPFAAKTKTALDCSQFQGVTLTAGSKCDVAIHHGQFFTSLANNIRKRMMTTRSSGRQSVKDMKANEDEYDNLLANINCLNPDTWPGDLENDALYGEIEVSSLCQRFSLPTRQCIQGFREFKNNGGKRLCDDLLPLKKAISTLVVSTADCERGFSQMNILMNETRTSLSIPRLAKLLFIKCCGPPLNRFSPQPYVKTWLLKGHINASDTKARARNLEDATINNIENESLWTVM